MSQNPAKDAFIPGLIGNFNIPKSVIENKVDVLTFLEILVRKNIVSANELDEIRAAVVAHLNAIYPELDLAYTTPESMGQQAGLGGTALPPKPSQNKTAAAQAFSTPPNSQASFKPSEASAGYMAKPDQQVGAGYMTSSQVKPGEATQEAPKDSAAEQQGTAAQAPVNKPLWVQAPPPKFIK